MNKRVFVSSTFSDLSSYRLAVNSIIRQLGAIDVSMEHLGARDERPKDECFRLIREESDIFVGIIAHKYGFIPEGECISITEAEYDYAGLIGLPRLIYIIDDSAPWIPELIDNDHLGYKLRRLKDRLKNNHICAFFFNCDDLAAKVAADLGRTFLNWNLIDKGKNAFQLERGREERLIEQLRSTDSHQIERAIQALAPSQSPWLVDELRNFILGDNEQLADASIRALQEISGHRSAQMIALGLNSSLWPVRYESAFVLGEMALFKRRKDALTIIDNLIEALHNPAESGEILEEIAHSIGKIGGRKAYVALIELLKSENIPPFLKARALHGPIRFWSNPLREQFIQNALQIISDWTPELCRDILDCHISRYMDGPLKQALKAHTQNDSNFHENA